MEWLSTEWLYLIDFNTAAVMHAFLAFCEDLLDWKGKNISYTVVYEMLIFSVILTISRN